MNYLNYCNCDLLNGEGIRCVVWVSGCTHNCEGCFSKNTHNPKAGTLFDEEFQNRILNDLNHSFISGLTWSGGDPLHKRNVEAVIAFSKRVKATLPDKDIWLYTGYTEAQIKDDPLRAPILDVIDVLVDGKFDISKKVAGQFYGSSNQRIIYINGDK